MDNLDLNLIFPPHVISALSAERGPVWRELVGRAQNSGVDSLEQVAFIFLMAQLNNCASCNADSYRAIQGCTTCAKQALKRFHESDDELVRLFESAKSEVKLYTQSKIQTNIR